MKFDAYQKLLTKLPTGKRLPDAVYVFWDGATALPQELEALVVGVAKELSIGSEFNVLKFHAKALKVSFLSYPRFFDDPHPALEEAITVDLVLGKARRTDYRNRENPPILHRKETLLSKNHGCVSEFEALTRAEERAGLYDNARTIGFRLNWERLLEGKGLYYEGHQLVEEDFDDEVDQTKNKPRPIQIDRHKTAMARYDLSKPTKTLIEFGVLRPGKTFFDYGCGLGSDVQGLRALGYDAGGWDPVHAPDEPKNRADVVNLGYVINVIEDPVERIETLVEAWNHTDGLLIVSSMIKGRESYTFAREYGDGLITQRNTFQKYLDQGELQSYIEDALDKDAVPVGLGTFYVFRDPAAQQDFLSIRSKRPINWEEISQRLGFVRPERAARVPRLSIYEQHKEVLDAFWERMLDLGRIPKKDEFERYEEVRKAACSGNQAARLFVEKFGQETLEEARRRRHDDLLVYIAMAQFQKRIPFNNLSKELQTDIKTFFGNYNLATEKAKELLFAAGDPGEIELACEELEFGWFDEKEGHYVFHRSLLDKLPPLLRVYVSCGAIRYGDPTEADILKIHTHSRKLTFQYYDDFEGKDLPELTTRIKIDLKRCFVNVFDHSEGSRRQLLFFKERFLPKGCRGRKKMENFSAKLRKLGLNEENIGYGPDKEAFYGVLEPNGLKPNLNSQKNVVPTAKF